MCNRKILSCSASIPPRLSHLSINLSICEERQKLVRLVDSISASLNPFNVRVYCLIPAIFLENVFLHSIERANAKPLNHSHPFS